MLTISTYPFLLDVAVPIEDLVPEIRSTVTPIALLVLLVVILLIRIFIKINKK